MKKIFIISILLTTFFLIIYSCEKDDFCTQKIITPNLILRFYNKDSLTKFKTVKRLSIIARGKLDSLYTNLNTDSISIPLNPLTKKTVYIIKTNEKDGSIVNNKIATLTIKYKSKDKYVSRSCGFIVNFNDVYLEKTNWFDSLSVKSIKFLKNQKKAHVKIYH